jgi:hypothetical protein
MPLFKALFITTGRISDRSNGPAMPAVKVIATGSTNR